MSQPHDALGLKHRRASGVDDFASTYELFLTAANGLRARGHRDLLDDTVARRARALAFRAHAFSHDADGFWLAEHDGERVGFGIATARQGFWHLNACMSCRPSRVKGSAASSFDAVWRTVAGGAWCRPSSARPG